MRNILLAAWIFALVGCAASKPELKTSNSLEAQPTDAKRKAQIVHYENELREWDKRALNVKSAAVALKSDETYVNHAKAIDDMEAQSKEARLHLRELQLAEDAKEEADARNLLIENLTTIEKIYRQIQAE